MQNRFGSWIIIVAAMLLPVFIPGCGSDETGPPPVLVSLSVTPVNSSTAPGTTTQLMAIGTFSNNSMRNLTTSVVWTSSDTGIAAISNQGVATATMNIGSTTITAASGTIAGSTTLSTSPVASITVTPSTPPSIAPGMSQPFAASGTLADSTVQNLTTWATWNSSDTGVATVSDASGSKGLATAVAAPGTAMIEATYGGVVGSATLTSSAVASIAVTPASTSIANGTTQQFTASGTLADSTVQNLTTLATWDSSDTGIATISNTSSSKGLATSVAVGSALITAEFSGVTSPSAALTVTPAVLASIAVTPKNQSIALGKTQQFIAIGTFTDHTTQDISSSATWTSSKLSVATISNTSGSKGLATSLAEGTTTITASFSGITSNTATLKITPGGLVSIAVTPASASLATSPAGLTQQFSATGTFTDGSTQNLTTSVNWVSSDTTIAAISNADGSQGLATANPFFVTGSTNITADFAGITSNTATLTVHF